MIGAPEVVALIAVTVAVAALAPRLRIPAPVALTVVGVVASFVPGIPEFGLGPELVLTGFLPPLLYAAAIRTPFVSLKRNRRDVALLSVGLVLATTAAVAAVTHLLLPDLPLAAAVALGAVVSPPDAVAATAVGRRIGLPRKVLALLEAESLLNDATALVALRTALTALGVAEVGHSGPSPAPASSAGEAVSVLGVAGDFGAAVAFGVLTGLLVAVVAGWIRRRVTDPVLDTTVSLIVPYAAYLSAEQVHGSGVLAVVVAGLVLGHRSAELQSAASRLTERTLWRSVTFVLESVVFGLIGLQLRMLVQGARDSDLAPGLVVGVCLGVSATVIVVRLLWIYPATYLPRLWGRIRLSQPMPPVGAVTVVGWAGMRGAVTLAAAAVLPQDRYRPVLVLAAFSVVATTLVVQGWSLPAVVRLLRVPGPDAAQEALQQALVLQRAVDAGRRRLDAEVETGAPAHVVKGLIAFSDRLAQSVWERLADDGGSEPPSRAFRRLRVAMLDAERRVVVDVHRSGAAAPEVLDGVLERLDQEEAMLGGFLSEAPGERGQLRPPPGAEGCEHLRTEPLATVPATPEGCQDCLSIGFHDWVALRMCVRCGRVGCCESSPYRHAEAHFGDSGHPVMRSIELGDEWRWCYVDRELA